jgi:hypothetical protein
LTETSSDIGVQLFTFGILLLPALCILSIITRGNLVKMSQLRGIPFFFIPLVYCFLQIRAEVRLRRGQRIAAFLQLANDLRMRKQRVDGRVTRRSSR